MYLFALLLLTSCSTASISADGFYGESFKPEKFVALDDLTAQLNGQDSINAVVKGKVESVCQKKGCWMNIVSDNGESMFVKFKDYGFFMPLDLTGKEVVMNGYAFTEMTSVDDLRHYAEDEGAAAEEIEQIITAKKEFKFMASGVYVAE